MGDKMTFDEANRGHRQVFNKKGIIKFVVLAVLVLIGFIIVGSILKTNFRKKKTENALAAKQEELAKRSISTVKVNHDNPLKKQADIDASKKSFIFLDSEGNRVRYGTDDQMYYVDDKGNKLRDIDPAEFDDLIESTKIIAEQNNDVKQILDERDANKNALNQSESQPVQKSDEEYLREKVEALGYNWPEFLGKLNLIGSDIDAVMTMLDMQGHDKLKDIIEHVYNKASSISQQPQPTSEMVRVNTGNLTSGTSNVDLVGDPTPSWLRDGMNAADEAMTATMQTLNNLASTAASSGSSDTWKNVANPSEKLSWIQQQQAGQSGYAGQLTQWDLAPGTIIPIILYTGLKTDQPGEVIGTVKGNVYDTLTGKNILIPRGSTVQATYNNSVTFGQKSVQIAWNLLITPDGRVYNLPGLNGIDNNGYTGVKGNVNNHFWSILGGAALGSIIQFNSQYVESYINRVAGNSYQAQLVKAASDSLNETASDFALRYAELWASLGPTITIKKAADISVMVNRIISFDPKLTRNGTANF